MKISAAYLEALGEPLKYSEEIELPALKDGQVLVAIAYSGVCHSQLMEARGLRGKDAYLPHMLGHEGSGVVLQIGSNVSKVSEGDHVVLGWIKGDGIEAGGSKYKLGSQIINAGGVTTFQSHSVVSENRIVKIDKKFPLDVAVLFGCAIPTGAGAILNSSQLAKDGSILIWGLGGIGMSALLATKFEPFKQIIVIDIEDRKLAIAKELGAHIALNAKTENVHEQVMKLTNNQGVDLAVEAAGLTETIELAFQLTRKNGGTCIFASHPKFGDKIKLDPFDLISGKKIYGTWGGECKPDQDIPRFVEYYKSGHWPLEMFFSKRYSLKEVNQALNDLENRKVNRALLEINSEIGFF